MERWLEPEVVYADFETVLREADFVSLHTPLTPETRGLIDGYALCLMKPSAVLVNTSRGPVRLTRSITISASRSSWRAT
ncbi:MAG: NAD(P)-dependent oxidoreductase [Anaerolineae bacterium]